MTFRRRGASCALVGMHPCLLAGKRNTSPVVVWEVVGGLIVIVVREAAAQGSARIRERADARARSGGDKDVVAAMAQRRRSPPCPVPGTGVHAHVVADLPHWQGAAVACPAPGARANATTVSHLRRQAPPWAGLCAAAPLGTVVTTRPGKYCTIA
jgi:hypothetical protein